MVRFRRVIKLWARGTQDILLGHILGARPRNHFNQGGHSPLSEGWSEKEAGWLHLRRVLRISQLIEICGSTTVLSSSSLCLIHHMWAWLMFKDLLSNYMRIRYDPASSRRSFSEILIKVCHIISFNAGCLSLIFIILAVIKGACRWHGVVPEVDICKERVQKIYFLLRAEFLLLKLLFK